MGLLDRYRAKREAKRKADNERYVAERTGTTNSFGLPMDPGSTALLYTTVASDRVEQDADQSDQSDDTALDDTRNDAVGSFESDSDRYHTDTNYGSTYEAPKYDFSGPSDTQSYGSADTSSSYDSGSSSSYDSGSSSSYDSGSSSSFD